MLYAMSDVDELTAAQEAELRADLEHLVHELESQLAGGREGAATVNLDEPIGRLSRIDALAQQQVARAGQQAARVRLEQVRAALRRMEDGEYGYCLRTGEPIGFRRLKARPETTLSLEGQAELEQQRRG